MEAEVDSIQLYRQLFSSQTRLLKKTDTSRSLTTTICQCLQLVYSAKIFIVYAVVIKYYPKCTFLNGFNLAALL